MRRWIVGLGLFGFFLSLSWLGTAAPAGTAAGAGSSATGPQAVPSPAQDAEAVRLYKQMARLPETDVEGLIGLHRQVVETCPATAWAAESHWRLSNLYLFGFDQPDRERIVFHLETLLKRYPTSPLVPQAQQRLLVSYRELGAFDRIVALYGPLFRDKDTMPDGIFLASAFEYAEALEEVGRKADADRLYEEILTRDRERRSDAAALAAARLGRR